MPIPEFQTPLYIISINKDFWLKSKSHHLISAGLLTYEREFLKDEPIHSDFNSALKFAVVIASRHWEIFAGPDGRSLYKDRIIEELEIVKPNNRLAIELIEKLSLIDLSLIGFDDRGRYGLSEGEILLKVMSDYERIYNLHKQEFDLLQSAYEIITDAPFKITKVNKNA